jgi:hypothetical protein
VWHPYPYTNDYRSLPRYHGQQQQEQQQQQQLPNPPPVDDNDDDDDDDYYDVDTDEEIPDAEATTTTTTTSAMVHTREQELHHILSLGGHTGNLRSYEAFLNKPNVLATYIPKFTTSPLMDEATARIFCHFVTATGPLLSAYGRHPVNPALIFAGTAVPKSQQALWTYALPLLALSHQGLLHAILALASLQIARLQQAPLTVPIKHYQFALRRVAKAVANPNKRNGIATVAATLLLGHFEVISGEHSKWKSHLAGARQLLTEVNFKGWTKRILEEKARVASSTNIDWSSRPYVNAQFQSYGDELPWIPESGSMDEDIIGQLTGVKIKYDRQGSIEVGAPKAQKVPPTEKDMDDYQTYRDLFWMYAKIDNIQALVAGRRLL